MATTVRATYSGGVLKPVAPLDLREGEQVTLSIESGEPANEAHESLLEMFDRLRNSVQSDVWDDLPADLAANKKHYLYGSPKEPD